MSKGTFTWTDALLQEFHQSTWEFYKGERDRKEAENYDG